MNRRKLMAALPAFVTYPLLNSHCWGADADQRAKFVWHVPGDRLGTAKDYLREPLNQEPEKDSGDATRGLPLLLIISAIALIPQLAEAVVRVYRGYEYGGVLITSEHGTLQILTDRRLPPGMVIVKSDRGVTVYQAENPSADDLLSPMKSILKAGK
jgi:hypothetical protein